VKNRFIDADASRLRHDSFRNGGVSDLYRLVGLRDFLDLLLRAYRRRQDKTERNRGPDPSRCPNEPIPACRGRLSSHFVTSSTTVKM
jgi:hypothetical protein